MRRRKLAALAGGAMAVVAAGAYLTGVVLVDDTTPRNASVGGVAIGGLDRADAIARLEQELADQAAADVTLTAGAREVSLSPRDAGLGLDYAASVDLTGTGRTWDPRRIIEVWRGGGPHAPVVTVDLPTMGTGVTAVAKKLDVAARDATVGYRVRDGKVRIITAPGRDAVHLDRDAVPAAVVAAYQRTGTGELPATVAPPAITTAEASEVAGSVAQAAVAAPVTVQIKGSGRFTVTAVAIAKATTFPATDGKPTATIDPAALRKQAERAITALDLDEPVDAKITFADGKPKIVPSQDGVSVEAAALADAVRPALTKTGGGRTVEVASTGAQARFSTSDAKKLQITEVVGEFTTKFPYAEYRNVNLGLAASKINNTLVRPKKVFSLNDALGPREAKYGWVDGYVIQGGKLTKELAGGISQSATTAYNAGFFAGMPDVEHHPHTLYFDRYPAGRESTIYYGSLDMRFRNDTPYGVLMQSFITKASPGSQGSITVRVWSTKYHTIKTATPTKSAYTSGRTVTDDSPDCEYQAPIPGFTARYYRAFLENGKEVRREKYVWKYSPGDEIRCG